MHAHSMGFVFLYPYLKVKYGGIFPSSWFERKSTYVVWMGEYHSLLLKGNSVARILWKLNVYFLCQNTF